MAAAVLTRACSFCTRQLLSKVPSSKTYVQTCVQEPESNWQAANSDNTQQLCYDP